MRASRVVAPFASVLLALAPAPAQAPEREPDARATGKVHEWKSADGLAYQYHLPKDYEAGAPINLTFVLHGSNLDRRWGFANHQAGTFRADDLVVCPDGTTSNGSGGFNFLQGRKDLERLHALHAELLAKFDVRATFVYGHSQGSFFAFLYAGAYPDDVNGVVGQASGVWIGTEATKKHHHQAVVLMHGTADPVVPYGQSVGGFDFYAKADYPHVRLRSLDGWNHWPAQLQTEQQLAWCEAMTTEDPARLAAAFAAIDSQKERVDPAALYETAKRVLATDGVDGKVKKAAEDAIAAVESCAGDHVFAIGKSLGKGKRELCDDAWVGHLPLFLRHFRGVPACDELAADWQKQLEKQQDVVTKTAREFWQNREQKPEKAFAAGLELVEGAFLTSIAENEEILGSLEKWAADGKALKLSKKELKAFKDAVPVLREAREQGRKAFEKVDRRFR